MLYFAQVSFKEDNLFFCSSSNCAIGGGGGGVVDVVLACEEDVIKFLYFASFEAYSCALAGASFALSSLYVFGRLVAGKVLVNILDHLKQDFAERCKKTKTHFGDFVGAKAQSCGLIVPAKSVLSRSVPGQHTLRSEIRKRPH